MFRMDNYLERWAEAYKPINHIPSAGSKERRFYRMDSITAIAPFMANLVNAKSPSMAYITQIDATLAGQSEKFVIVTHRVFFLVKQAGINLQNGVTEELAATDAKVDGYEMAQDLLAYLYHDYRQNKNKDLEGIDFKGASIFTTPQQFNGWWPTEVVFTQMQPRILCVNREKYRTLP